MKPFHVFCACKTYSDIGHHHTTPSVRAPSPRLLKPEEHVVKLKKTKSNCSTTRPRLNRPLVSLLVINRLFFWFLGRVQAPSAISAPVPFALLSSCDAWAGPGGGAKFYSLVPMLVSNLNVLLHFSSSLLSTPRCRRSLHIYVKYCGLSCTTSSHPLHLLAHYNDSGHAQLNARRATLLADLPPQVVVPIAGCCII